MKSPVPIRRALKRMRPYHPPLEGRAGKLRLDLNENTIGCSPVVRRALARIGRDQVAMYPEYDAARRCLARFFQVKPAELVLTNGTDDALRLLVNTFVEPRATVLVVQPTFDMYRFYAELAGARVKAARYDADMRFPLGRVEDTLRQRPCLFFLANPNNPTGTLVGLDVLKRILRAARSTLVVVDEAYWEFSQVTVLPWIRRYPNLAVTRTFSKASGLAGLRVGCLFANRTLITALSKAHSPYSVNTVALVAAQAAVRDIRFVRDYAQEVACARTELLKTLSRLKIKWFPTEGNFVLVDCGQRAPRLLAGLRRKGILVRDRSSDFGRVGYVRITVGTRAQTRQLIKALEQAWPS
jgi:histidinol-phosphate aminotransferase